jgi:hypothetical protein
MKKLFFILILISGCVPIPQSSDIQSDNNKVLQLSDMRYEPQIKTVRLTPMGLDSRSQLLPAVTPIGTQNLQLDFDDLRDQRDSYYARIIHCNQDWTKSSLSDLDYMPQYNEFPLTTFDFSLDTHIPYVHYQLKLPAVKLPGNYVVMVYRGSDKADIVLTKRFMVYDSRVSFLRQGSLIGPGAMASANQQLNFSINYKNVEIINPMETVNVTIQQNQRWDNLITGLKPSFLRENLRELEYRFFDPEKMAKGGNEFRFFDLRSLNYPGRNVATVDKTQKPFQVFVQPDKSRNGQAYAVYDDLNGNFNNDNYDFRNAVAGNYANVHFTLQSPEPVNGEVYLSGAFTNWSFLPEYKMTYDAIKKEYTGTAFLKQGWYDYQYIVKSSSLPSYYFEGSHYETENEYEIFIYYRSFQPQADLLIGYIRLVENVR